MTSDNFPLARFDARNSIPQMKRKVKADLPRNFIEYLESLFSQHIKDIRDHNIREKGQLLRKTRRAQLRMNAQDRSELNITTLLLPERYKLSPYYQTLSSEMNDNEKALVMRWWLEKTRKNPDKFNPINKRTNLQRSVSDNFLSYILFHYYGRLSKPEMYVCREILYAIWDSGDGIYDNIVSKLKENKTLFRTTHKVDSIIQRLMDKRVIYCKIHFRESKTDRLLKPKKILSLSMDVEIAAMSDLTSTNEKNMSWIDDLDTDDNHFPSDNFF